MRDRYALGLPRFRVLRTPRIRYPGLELRKHVRSVQLGEFMHTILGAGGVIGNELSKELSRRGERVRLVGRNPKPAGITTEAVKADLSDPAQTLTAIAGSTIVYLVAGLHSIAGKAYAKPGSCPESEFGCPGMDIARENLACRKSISTADLMNPFV